MKDWIKSYWIPWVALRYLRSKKNSKFLSFITFFSLVGIALGVMAMIIVLSVMDGFESELKKRLMATEIHLVVSPMGGGYVNRVEDGWKDLMAQLSKVPDVDSVWEVVATDTILKTERQDKKLHRTMGLTLKGVSEQKLARLKIVESSEKSQLFEQEGPDQVRLPGVYLGEELARELSIIPGDRVLMISPTEMEGALSSVPRMKRFVVEGIYSAGLPEHELSQAFAKEGDVRSFLRKADVVSEVEISLRHFEKAPDLAAQLSKDLPSLRVKDWSQLHAALFFSLRLERIAMFIALAFIVLVASFNIVTTLTLMVLEKRREISILRAMGAQSTEVARLFMVEGLLIGGSGIFLGLSLGGIVCLILKRYEVITLPDVYYDRTLPVAFDAQYYLWVAIVAACIVFVACWIPGRKASRVGVLEGIRL